MSRAPLTEAQALALYDDACRALDEVEAVGAALVINAEADAVRVFARQAKNKDLERKAAAIRIRAERRIGQLITVAKANGTFRRGRVGRDQLSRETLEDMGVDKMLSARAQRLAQLSDEQFERRMGMWWKTSSKEAGRISVRLVHDEDQRTRRKVREEILGRKIRELPSVRYGVIYADPPWRFEPRSRESGMSRAADNHYPTQPLDAIKALGVPALAARHCALPLWSTAPMVPQALEVMAAWGFEYRSQQIWRKLRPGAERGTGYWFHNEHEVLLLGVRGDIPAPAAGDQWPSVVEAEVGPHSAKPDVFAEMIEAYFPTLPKIELFRRGPARPGWDAWGNEVEEDAA